MVYCTCLESRRRHHMPSEGSNPSLAAILHGVIVACFKRAGIAQLVEHLTCNQGVAGSTPAAGTKVLCGECSSVGRAPGCDLGGRGFEPHHSPQVSWRNGRVV